jgi:hypothetical protein
VTIGPLPSGHRPIRAEILGVIIEVPITSGSGPVHVTRHGMCCRGGDGRLCSVFALCYPYDGISRGTVEHVGALVEGQADGYEA